MHKGKIKFIRSLHIKKNRRAEGLFVVEGRKSVETLLKSQIKVKEIYVTSAHEHDFRDAGGVGVSESEMQKISALDTPPGILAVCAIPPPGKEPNLNSELALALDGISDPGNMGTIIRVAHWFGIGHIYCSLNCTDVYGPKAVQGSMGSIASVHLHDVNLEEWLSRTDAVTIYGAVLNGKSVFTEKLKPAGVLVIGSEANGISKEIMPFIKYALSIPAFTKNAPDSLNAAIATAIICSEFRRR
jgi:TrmH family RNA methyltransferase